MFLKIISQSFALKCPEMKINHFRAFFYPVVMGSNLSISKEESQVLPLQIQGKEPPLIKVTFINGGVRSERIALTLLDLP